jgi:hypothetical protein
MRYLQAAFPQQALLQLQSALTGLIVYATNFYWINLLYISEQ